MPIIDRSSHPEVLLGKGVLKICSKFTGEHSFRSVISIKLLCSFIKITLWHGCSPVDLLHIFRTPFYKNTYGGLLLLLIKHLSFSIIRPEYLHRTSGNVRPIELYTTKTASQRTELSGVKLKKVIS